LRRQRGAVLVVALVFLLLMTVLGVTSMSSTTLQERMAGNLRDNNLAFQAAEAALRSGEELLRQATLPVFNGSDGLLQPQEEGGQAHFWTTYGWAANSRAADALDGVPSAPRFVVEEMPPLPAEGGSLRFGALPEVGFYRVTAYGTGGTDDAVVILQTTYRR
jgi:type IV pilus assembly protein PilX